MQAILLANPYLETEKKLYEDYRFENPVGLFDKNCPEILTKTIYLDVEMKKVPKNVTFHDLLFNIMMKYKSCPSNNS